MNKKAQLYAIREIFQFGLGILILTSVFYMFYNALIPTVEDYALELEADNINSHVNYLLMQVMNVASDDFIFGNIELEYSMPDSLGDYDYSVYFINNQVCTLINGLSINKCFETNMEEISASGAYFSGGKLKLTLSRTESMTTLVLIN
jgi:hypothetical protein